MNWNTECRDGERERERERAREKEGEERENDREREREQKREICQWMNFQMIISWDEKISKLDNFLSIFFFSL